MVTVSAPISRSPSTMAWPAITNGAPALVEMSAQMRSMSPALVPVQCTRLVPTWPMTWQCERPRQTADSSSIPKLRARSSSVNS